jgi:hypothetical protein
MLNTIFIILLISLLFFGIDETVSRFGKFIKNTVWFILFIIFMLLWIL